MLGRGATPAAIAAWNKQHGYDRPLVAQFLSYLGNLAHLNFGYSYKQGQSVAALFKENAGRSIYLSGVGARAVAPASRSRSGSPRPSSATALGDYAMTTAIDLRRSTRCRRSSSA